MRPTLPRDGALWTEADWARLDDLVRCQVGSARSEAEASAVVAAHARTVIRAFSTSFFIVTRFLPPAKRALVELIYAAVRQPDEVVDTFPLDAAEKRLRLDGWRAAWERARGHGSITESLAAGCPVFVAGFAAVERATGIPPEYYGAFLDAMARDVEPDTFATVEDLIDGYVYGSAVVVGYFLAHVYGPSAPGGLPRALGAARELGIALQLTNFLRDVAEDHGRGRLYLPLDFLLAEGLSALDPSDPAQREPLARVLRRLAAVAEEHYARAQAGLDAFAPDCRTAIAACIGVYRQLNERVGREPARVYERQSVPLGEKLRALPPSKYWRLPAAFLGIQERMEGASP